MAMVIEARRIFTAAAGEVLDDGVIVVDDDGRITGVGRRGEVEAPATAERFQARDQTAVPGLIDMHAHVLSGTDDETREGLTVRTITDQVLRGVNNARRCVLNGTTTIRDAGARHEGIFRFKKAIEEGWVVGPRIIPAGQAIAMSGGHGYNAVAAEADGPDEVRKLVRQQLKAGAECIKIMATGGAGTAGERVQDLQLTGEEIRAATEETHKKGYRTLAHVTTAEGVLLAVEAGVDCIEHGLLLDEAAAREMARRGAYYDPTLEAYERIVRLGTSAGYYDYMISKAAAVLEPHRESVRLARAAGVRLVAGTDAGGHFWQLGDMADELARMVECDLSPEEALTAATRTAAECLEREADVGTLQAGRFGDVLLVDGDPLEDIGALKRVHAVFKGGVRLR